MDRGPEEFPFVAQISGSDNHAHFIVQPSGCDRDKKVVLILAQRCNQTTGPFNACPDQGFLVRGITLDI